MSILVIAEHDKGELKGATLATIAAAQQLGDQIDLLVAGSDCAGVAEQAAKAAGVSRVLLAENAAYDHMLAENTALLVAELAKDYSHVLAPASTNGKNVLPRAAALLDVQAISDISAVISEDTFQRPIYAGNIIATVQTSDPIKVLTVRTTAFDPVPAEGGSATIEKLDSVHQTGLSEYKGEEVAKSDRPELTAAGIVISGGRGMQNGDNFEMLYRIADKLGAAVGASRAAVDAGFVANDMQVGQTGKIIAPELYVAIGISGAIQHMTGIKDAKTIVAINKDAEAPIFEVADYGIVGDLFEVVPALSEEIRKSK